MQTQIEKNLLHDLKQRVTNEGHAYDRLELEVLISFSKADYWHRSRLKWQWQKSWCDGIWSASAPMNLLVRTQCSEKIKKISILTFSWLVSEASNAHSSPVWEVSLVLGSNPGHVVFLALVDDNVRETSQLVVLRSVEKYLVSLKSAIVRSWTLTAPCDAIASFPSSQERSLGLKSTWKKFMKGSLLKC